MTIHQTYHRPDPRELPILILDDGAVQVFAPYRANRPVRLAPLPDALRVTHHIGDTMPAGVIGKEGGR